MANPSKYIPGYSYSGWQASYPVRPLPAPQVDNDFANISQSINALVDAMRDVRRADGTLPAGIVGPDQLSSVLKLGFTMRGMWAAGTEYKAGDGVVYLGAFYSAKTSHRALAENAPPSDLWTYLFSVDDLVVSGALSIPVNTFIGDGVNPDFDLDFTPVTTRNLFVTVGGQIQETTQYSIDGNRIIFNDAPPSTYRVEVRGFATYALDDIMQPVNDAIDEFIGIASGINPITELPPFTVSVGQTSVTVPGGYDLVAYVLLEGLRISDWSAPGGGIVTFPAITADDTAGEATAQMIIGVGYNSVLSFDTLDGGAV